MGPGRVCLLFLRNLTGTYAQVPHGLCACIISRHTRPGPTGSHFFEFSKKLWVRFLSIKTSRQKAPEIPIVWESKFIFLEKSYGSPYTNFIRIPYLVTRFHGQDLDLPYLQRWKQFMRIFYANIIVVSKIEYLVIYIIWPNY